VALPKYKGMLGTVGTIAKEEGLSALWKGIVPGLHRQCLYGGLRIGLYEPVSILTESQRLFIYLSLYIYFCAYVI
jgi:solute carrier family 25 uncoupling protein 8/9